METDIPDVRKIQNNRIGVIVVDFEEKKEWLKSYKDLKNELDYINSGLINIKAIKYSYDVGGNPVDINKLLDKKDKVVHKLEEIEDAISVLQTQYRIVLGYRYIRFYTIDCIADKTHYSSRQICRHIKKGIELL